MGTAVRHCMSSEGSIYGDQTWAEARGLGLGLGIVRGADLAVGLKVQSVLDIRMCKADQKAKHTLPRCRPAGPAPLAGGGDECDKGVLSRDLNVYVKLFHIK